MDEAALGRDNEARDVTRAFDNASTAERESTTRK